MGGNDKRDDKLNTPRKKFMKHIPLELVKPHFTSTGINVDVVLKHYPTFQYVGQFALKTRTDHTDFPVDVFYEPNPDVEQGHSHYVAVYVNDGKAMITNAVSVTDMVFTGSYTDDDTIIYPRFQHDFRYFNGDRNFCDGGWWLKSQEPESHGCWSMQTRWGGASNKLLTLRVIDGKIYDILGEDGGN